MFIADQGNYRIRKVDASGIVSTYFGTGTTTVAGNGGAATSASGAPYIAFGDSVGNIYFSDNSHGKIRKIDADSIVTDFAGGGTLGGTTSNADNGAPATCSFFNYLTGVATDTNGDVYLVDTNNNKIKKVSCTTNILTIVAGSGGQASPDTSANNGNGGLATSTAAKITLPLSLHLSTTNVIYFCGFSTGFIRQVDLSTGIISLFAGGSGTSGYTGDGGLATAAQLQSGISSVAGDRDGNIYHTTQANNNVRVISSSGIINAFAGSSAGTAGYSGDGGAATLALLKTPSHMFVQDNTLYIADGGNNVIRSTSLTLSVLSSSAPSIAPSCLPSVVPTLTPTVVPSTLPPTVIPSLSPSEPPTTITPTVVPSMAPSAPPTTIAPSALPTTTSPSVEPSIIPTMIPTSAAPSNIPSLSPTAIPSVIPTHCPTVTPSVVPTACPSVSPTTEPSIAPSVMPSIMPTTIAPSLQPSPVPTTAAPTLQYVDITFDTGVYLHNVTASILDATCQAAVTEAVAETLEIDGDQVVYVSQHLIGTEGRRKLASVQANQILVTVNVFASTRDFSYATNKNGSFLYHRLLTTLNSAVDTNVFTRTVRETSANLGAVATLYVGHVNLTVTDFTVVTSTPESTHDSTGLSAGAIAGIVIGGVTFLFLLIACCFLALRRRRNKDNKIAIDNKTQDV